MDINGGSASPNPNGSPLLPGTSFTGPLIAGNVLHSDGSGTLASNGGSTGQANAGYVVMAQSAVVTQASGAAPSIVIPAQSQILRITAMITTAFTGGAATFGLGTTVSATAFTGATALTGAALGPQAATPGTSATAIGNWDNVGNTDVELLLTATNTGSGVATVTVEYVQSINLAS
jgi:hypothetical protein